MALMKTHFFVCLLSSFEVFPQSFVKFSSSLSCKTMSTIVEASHPSPRANDLNGAEINNGTNVINVNGIPIQTGNNLNVRTINGLTYVNGIEIPPGAPNVEIARNDAVIVDGAPVAHNYGVDLDFPVFFSIFANFFSIVEACIIFKEYMLAATIIKCVIYALMTIILCAAICYRVKLWIFIMCIVSTVVIIIFNIISNVLIFVDLPIFAGNRDPEFIAFYIFELIADGFILWAFVSLYNFFRRISKAKKEKGSKHVQVQQRKPDDHVQISKKTEKSKSQTNTQKLNGSKVSAMSMKSQQQRFKETGDEKSKSIKEESVSKQQQSQSKSREPTPKASNEAVVASKKSQKHSKKHAGGKSKPNKDESKPSQ